MPSRTQALVRNKLIHALPQEDQQRLVRNCELVDLAFSSIVAEAGAPLQYAIFPIRSFVSLIAPVDGRAHLEVGMIGNEGMLGATIALGPDWSPLHAVVQGSGQALIISTANFQRELERSRSLRVMVMRYLHVMIWQLGQTAACSHFHVVEKRLARWLLMTQDRAGSDSFHLTQEFLAYMLGVRRVGVTRAASSLQTQQLISYHRGEIKILRRVALEAASCDCYAEDAAMYNRVMSG